MKSPLSTDDSFVRSAGKQLAIYALVAVVVISVLMVVLDFIAGLTSSGTSGAAGAVDVENNEISIYLRDEPPQLNSTQATDSISIMVLGHLMEGLLRYDEHDQV